MSKKASRKPADVQREVRAVSAAAPNVRPTALPSLIGWRRWVARVALMVLVPVFLLGILELGLRAFGYGYATSFFLRMEDGLNYTANQAFSWQFFPRETATYPHPFLMPVHKKPGTLRIFILGESAALGTPAPPFGFGRILEVMLRQQFPDRSFEVINAAMRGIDSNIVLPIAKECAEHQPDLFIVYMGNNEAIGLYSPDPLSRNLLSRRFLLRASQRLKATKLYQFLGTLFPKSKTAAKAQDMEFFRQHRFPANAPARGVIFDNFQANLEDISRVTRKSGAKVLVSTVGVNLKDFPPVASLHRASLTEPERARWEGAFTSGNAAEAAGRPAQALTNYLEALRLDDHFAELHFRLARCYRVFGDVQKALDHYRLSREWDALQFRMDSRRNQIIRDVASHLGNGVFLVDAEAALAASPFSEYQIPGNRLFNDHVHLSFDGDYLLAQTFLPVVASSLGLTNTTGLALPSRAECAEVLAFTDWEEINVALGMLGSLNKPPFLDQLEHAQQHSAAEQALRQRFNVVGQKEHLDQIASVYRAAIARSPGDWQFHFIFAGFLSDRQDYTGAAEEFRAVVNIFPKLPPMRLSLAEALLKAGKVNEALDQLSEILRIDPEYTAAKTAMVQIQAQRVRFRPPK